MKSLEAELAGHAYQKVAKRAESAKGMSAKAKADEWGPYGIWAKKLPSLIMQSGPVAAFALAEEKSTKSGIKALLDDIKTTPALASSLGKGGVMSAQAASLDAFEQIEVTDVLQRLLPYFKAFSVSVLGVDPDAETDDE